MEWCVTSLLTLRIFDISVKSSFYALDPGIRAYRMSFCYIYIGVQLNILYPLLIIYRI
jgi:hypothetical protein